LSPSVEKRVIQRRPNSEEVEAWLQKETIPGFLRKGDSRHTGRQGGGTQERISGGLSKPTNGGPGRNRIHSIFITGGIVGRFLGQQKGNAFGIRNIKRREGSFKEVVIKNVWDVPAY